MRTLLVALCLVASSAAAFAQQAGDSAKGHDYALKVCAACHAVEGTAASPNTDAPSFFSVANTPGMTEMALGAFLFTPHRLMPDLVIPVSDARDLIAYILSLKRLPPF
jgi:mono/diheme cytochrome c family protein